MINRYQGNSGRVVRVEDRAEAKKPAPVPEYRVQNQVRQPQGIMEQLGKLLPVGFDFETEDLILLLILYLMYRESGDSELLIIMGAMFLL